MDGIEITKAENYSASSSCADVEQNQRQYRQQMKRLREHMKLEKWDKILYEILKSYRLQSNFYKLNYHYPETSFNL